jgi:protein CpxP
MLQTQAIYHSTEIFMKIITAVLASTLLIGSAAIAQTAAQANGAYPSTKAPASHDKVEMHIKDLHAKLKINASEEGQWAAVAKVMHENAHEIDTAVEKRESLRDNASAIDDLNAYGDIAQVHTDAVKKLSAAFAPLYTSMPDSQKKLADQVFMQRGKTGS